MQSQLNTKTLA